MRERRAMKFLWKRYARRIVLPLGGLAITAVMLLPIYFTLIFRLLFLFVPIV